MWFNNFVVVANVWTLFERQLKFKCYQNCLAVSPGNELSDQREKSIKWVGLVGHAKRWLMSYGYYLRAELQFCMSGSILNNKAEVTCQGLIFWESDSVWIDKLDLILDGWALWKFDEHLLTTSTCIVFRFFTDRLNLKSFIELVSLNNVILPRS